LLASRLVAGLADSLSVAWQQSLESASDREALLRSWLETLSRDAERAGIAVVLSTVASNLWFPPDIDAGERQDPAVLEASLLDARRATDESVATLQALVDRAPTPYRHYLLGRRLAKGGRAEAAARHLDAAIETSRRDPDRAPRAVNEVLRSMEGRNGVVLHDTMQRMAERSPSGLPGWNVLRDHCHLQPALWTEEARAVLQTCIELARDPAIEEIAIARDRPSGWDSLLEPARGLVLAQEAAAPPRVERFQRAFVTLVQQHAEREPARTRRRLQRWLEESSQLATATSSERTAIVVAIADGFVEAGRLRAALRTNAWVRREPSAAVWTQLGRIRLARGRQAAARRAFEHAIAVDARDIEARFFRDRLAAGPKVEHGR
jgi:tetratricopeptide (TPR) repeat protein